MAVDTGTLGLPSNWIYSFYDFNNGTVDFQGAVDFLRRELNDTMGYQFSDSDLLSLTQGNQLQGDLADYDVNSSNVSSDPNSQYRDNFGSAPVQTVSTGETLPTKYELPSSGEDGTGGSVENVIIGSGDEPSDTTTTDTDLLEQMFSPLLSTLSASDREAFLQAARDAGLSRYGTEYISNIQGDDGAGEGFDFVQGGADGITGQQFNDAISRLNLGLSNDIMSGFDRLSPLTQGQLSNALGDLNFLNQSQLDSSLSDLNFLTQGQLDSSLRRLPFLNEYQLNNALGNLNFLNQGQLDQSLSGLDLFGRSDLTAGLTDFFSGQGNPISGLNNLGMDDINRALSSLDLFGANDLSAGLSNYFGSEGDPLAGLKNQISGLGDMISGLDIPSGGMSLSDLFAMGDGFSALSDQIGGINPLTQSQVTDALQAVFTGDANPLNRLNFLNQNQLDQSLTKALNKNFYDIASGIGSQSEYLSGLINNINPLTQNQVTDALRGVFMGDGNPLGGLQDRVMNLGTQLGGLGSQIGALNNLGIDDIGNFFGGNTEFGDPFQGLYDKYSGLDQGIQNLLNFVDPNRSDYLGTDLLSRLGIDDGSTLQSVLTDVVSNQFDQMPQLTQDQLEQMYQATLATGDEIDVANIDLGSLTGLGNVNDFTGLDSAGLNEFLFDQPILDMPEIQDYSELLRQPLIDRVLSGLDAANPYDTRMNQVIAGPLGNIERQYQEAEENLVNRFGQMNLLGSPAFSEQLRKLQDDKAQAELNVRSQFGMEAARQDEGLRRNRLSDLSQTLGSEYNRAQNEMQQQSAMQEQANQGLSNFIATQQAAYLDPQKMQDEGLRMMLGGIGSTLQPNVGAAMSGLGSVANSYANTINTNNNNYASLGANLYNAFNPPQQQNTSSGYTYQAPQNNYQVPQYSTDINNFTPVYNR